MANANPRLTVNILGNDGPLGKTLAAARGKLAAFDRSVAKLERSRNLRKLERSVSRVDTALTGATVKAALFGGAVAAAGVAGAAGLYAVVVAGLAVSAMLAGGFALAIGGIGIAFASQFQTVKDAFSGMKNTIKAEGKNLAAPLEKPLVGLAGKITEAFRGISPALGRIFTAMAPVIDAFGTGLANSAGRVGTLLETAFAAGLPVLQAVGRALTGPLLTGLTGFFAALGSGSTLADGTYKVLAAFGNFLPSLGQGLMNLIPVMQQIGSDLLKPIGQGFQELFSILSANGESTSSFIAQLGQSFKQLIPAVGQVIAAAQPLAQVFLAVLVPGLVGLAAVLGKLAGPLRSVATFLQQHKTLATALGVTLVGLVVGIKAVSAGLALYRVATAAATAVSTAFGIALSINPISLVAIAIAALVAGLVVFFTKTEIGRQIVSTAFEAIKVYAGILKDGILMYFGAMKAYIEMWVGVVRGIVGAVSGAFNSIVGAARNLLGGVQGAIGGLIGFVRGIPGQITGALGNLGGLLSGAGRAVMQGFIDGVNAMIGKLKSALKKVTSMIPDIKGPLSYDKIMLVGAGKAVMGGFIRGLESQYGNVRSTLSGLTSEVAGTQFAAPGVGSVPLNVGRMGSGGGVVQHITIKVEATPLTDKAAMARDLAEIIRDGQRLGVSV